MDSDRLSGWKEIAAHLRRSVRAAQRWEHELGLPVKRVKTVAGQVVFASRADLDAWLAKQHSVIQAEPVDPVELSEPADDIPVAAGSRSRVERRHPLMTMAAVVTILLVLGAWAWWPRTSATPVDSVTIVGKRLEARGADGRVLWHHQFDEDVRGLTLTDYPRGPLITIEGVDIDADGSTEWLIPLRFGDVRGGFRRSDAVAAFSAAGKLRWLASVPADFTLTCGGVPVQGPWQVSAMSVPNHAGPRSVWLAFHHPVSWPAFAVEVTPDGTVTRRYVQAGWIKSILEHETPTGRQVEIAGVINERERASLVSIDPEAALSALTPLTPEFACDLDAPSDPLRVVLFPPHDVTAAFHYKYFLATAVYRHGDGLRVSLAGGSAVAMMDAAGVVTDVTFIDDYWLQHDALFRDGRLDHPSDSCPQAHAPGEVESWDGKSWTTYPVRRVIPARATTPRER